MKPPLEVELQESMDAAEQDLRPCPFCGEYHDLIITGDIGEFYVECPCGLEMGLRVELHILVHQWNRRVIITCVHEEEPNGDN